MLNTKKEQQVIDIIGKQVGRVPKQLAELLKGSIVAGNLLEGMVFYIGDFYHVPYAVKVGGPLLKCLYILLVRPNSVMSLIKNIASLGINVNIA